MSADPVLVAETKAWLRKASLYLRAAEHDLTASPPLLADAMFHCQQTAEKTLKAFLMWHNTPFRKIIVWRKSVNNASTLIRLCKPL